MSNLENRARRCQIRSREISEMKIISAIVEGEVPHPDFLGRKTETGQAFYKTMKFQQCCYACQGMMGYKVPAQFKQKHVKSYLCHLNWEKRAGNAHPCTEIEVGLQCSRSWLE